MYDRRKDRLSLVSLVLVLLTFSSRLEILKVLTRDGKDIEYMEEAIGMWSTVYSWYGAGIFIL